MSTHPTMLRNGGTSAWAHAVVHAAVCSTVRPRPPTSTGQWIPANPASKMVACQARPAAARCEGRIGP